MMDFGLKYMCRIFIYSSTFLFGYLLFAIVLLLEFFGFISFKVPLIAKTLGLFDIITVLTVLMIMLYYGAVINNQFEVDRIQL